MITLSLWPTFPKALGDVVGNESNRLLPECVRVARRLYAYKHPCFTDNFPADLGTINFKKFAVAFGKSPGHGPVRARRTYNFLPKANTDHDLGEIEKRIAQKLLDRCEVAWFRGVTWMRYDEAHPPSPPRLGSWAL